MSRVHIGTAKLPPAWRETPAPAALAAIGDRFARTRRAAILLVPSALVPDEYNWLLNPDHDEFDRIRIKPPEPCSYEPRFLV